MEGAERDCEEGEWSQKTCFGEVCVCGGGSHVHHACVHGCVRVYGVCGGVVRVLMHMMSDVGVWVWCVGVGVGGVYLTHTLHTGMGRRRSQQ